MRSGLALTGPLTRPGTPVGGSGASGGPVAPAMWCARDDDFGLELVEGLKPSDVVPLGVPLVVTSSHHGEVLQSLTLPWPCAWAFGHEGQGLCEALSRRAALSARIAQPGGEESLNVAAAAAICLHASAISRVGSAYPE